MTATHHTTSRTGIGYDKATGQHLCAHCGQPYTPPAGYESRQRFCSTRCRNMHHNPTRDRKLNAKAPPRNCALCGAEYRSRKKSQKYCGRSCAANAYHRRSGKPLTVLPKKAKALGNTAKKPPKIVEKLATKRATKAVVVKGEKAAVLPPTDTVYSKGTFTDAEFEAAYREIRRELQAQGKPLYQMTADMVRDVSVREVMRDSSPVEH